MSNVIAQFHKGKYVNKPIQLGATLAKDVILEDGDSVDAKFRRLKCNSNGELAFNGKNLVRSVNGVNADASGNVQTGFPSDTFINVTSFPFTAPSNGWITVSAVATASQVGAYVTLVTRSSGGIGKLISFSARNNDTQTTTGDTLPVKKGDIVDTNYNNMRLNWAKFFYAEGEI